MDNNIVALVVTYNRLELLKESLEALKNQTVIPSKIIVYNNCSTDGTTEFLNSLNEDIFHIINADLNSGGAGGFHYGIKEAYNSGADWVWVMDDDTIPTPTALENMVKSPFFPLDECGNTTGYFASRVDWIDGNRHLMNYIHPYFPWHHFHGIHPNTYRILNSSFVSMMISREAIERVGLPVKEFFIWGDDWEYSGRISEKFRCYYSADSVVVHKTAENIAAHVDQINKSNYWKFRYNAINTTSFRPKTLMGYLEFTIDLLKKVKSMAKAKVKVRYILGYVKNSHKGLFFNYKKYIEYVH